MKGSTLLRLLSNILLGVGALLVTWAVIVGLSYYMFVPSPSPGIDHLDIRMAKGVGFWALVGLLSLGLAKYLDSLRLA